MPQCPVCEEQVNADQSAFTHHVNSHFESGDQGNGIGGNADDGDDGGPWPVDSGQGAQFDVEITGDTLKSDGQQNMDSCPVCGQSLRVYSETQKNVHVSDCLDGRTPGSSMEWGVDGRGEPDDAEFIYTEEAMRATGQAANDDSVAAGWEGSKGTWSVIPVSKGDKWWDPVNGRAEDVPSNFSPGVIPVLEKVLRASVSQGTTRSAVLSRNTVHIKGAWNFDMGWGCGYRNALMVISSLLIGQPSYRPIFSRNVDGTDPGVRKIQRWIESAWSAGYDVAGKDHFNGKLLGTRKWIGTSDLYAMFTFLGIPCDIYDFPKPRDRKPGAKSTMPTHHILQNWVRRYFAEDTSQGSTDGTAFDVLMRTGDSGKGRGEVVRMSPKYPMILQHLGHSRTIVGYEETGRGDINLLLFDPGRSVPREVRSTGIAGIPHLGKATQSCDRAEFSPPYTNGASEVYALPSSSKRVRTAEGDDAAEPDEGEELGSGGWVRKKVKEAKKKVTGPGASGSPTEALKVFRVNLSTLSNHAAYQVLAFTGGPILTEAEKRERRVIHSRHVYE